MTVSPPPSNAPIITPPDPRSPEDFDGMPAIEWALFFDQMFKGDAGSAWVPTVVNVGINGGVPTSEGRVYRISQYLAIFFITITPAPGGDTTGIAGTTYINNFPLRANGNGVCFAVSGLLGTVSGMVDKDSNLIFPPSWTNVSVPLTIIGIVEAS